MHVIGSPIALFNQSRIRVKILTAVQISELPSNIAIARISLLFLLVSIVLVNCLVSSLFMARQYREINQQAENNKNLLSAYMTKYINDIHNISKA